MVYHPAVWWLSKRIRAERELLRTMLALTVLRQSAEYARALALMEEWRVAPSSRWPRIAGRSLALAGFSVWPRRGKQPRNAGVDLGVRCLAAALLAGNALFGLVRSAAVIRPCLPNQSIV